MYTKYFKTGDLLTEVGMDVTGLLDDGAINDTTTYNSLVSPEEVDSTVTFTCMTVFDMPFNLTAWRFTVGSAFHGQPSASTGTYQVQYFNGSVWITLANGAWNLGSTGDVPIFTGNTKTGTCNVSATKVRLRITGHLNTGAAPHILTVAVSDFRETTTPPPQATGTFNFLGMASYGPSAIGTFDFVGSAEYARAIPSAPTLTVVTDCANDCDTVSWTVGAVYPPILESILYLNYVAPQNEIYRGPLTEKVRRREFRQEKGMYCVVVRNELGTSEPGFAISDRCDSVVVPRIDGWTRYRQG